MGCGAGAGCWLLPGSAAREAGLRGAGLVLEFYGACTKLLNFEFLATTAPGVKNVVYANALGYCLESLVNSEN